MIRVKCIHKFRDNSGNIKGYKLQSTNGEIYDVLANKLKEAIIDNRIYVENLTLTADNRLVDRNVEDFTNSDAKINKLRKKAEILGSTIKLPIYGGHVVEYIPIGSDTAILYIPDDVIITDIIFSPDKNSKLVGNTDNTELYVYGGVNIRNASLMFFGARFKTIHFENFGSGKVETMQNMFQSTHIKMLDLSKLSTISVKNMKDMFANAHIQEMSLIMDTSNVETMTGMFDSCQTNKIDLFAFDTRKVTKMDRMFAHCNAKEIKLNSFDTSNVTTMESMFISCLVSKLEMKNFSLKSCKNINGMFKGIDTTELDLSSFKIPRKCKTEDVFKYSRLKNIKTTDKKLLKLFNG